MEIYILNYNNYYNRIVKKETSLSAYREYQIGNAITNVSFNPNDGISTTQVINKPVNIDTGDYVICASGNDIISRWFILESKRERTGQYTLQLKRDVIVDYYNSVITSPAFIEKATLSEDDPLIYNNENMTFNQIKKSETLLKDKTTCPWIVGYFARTDGENITTLSGSYSYDQLVDIEFSGTIAQYPYSNNQNIYRKVDNVNIGIITNIEESDSNNNLIYTKGILSINKNVATTTYQRYVQSNSSIRQEPIYTFLGNTYISNIYFQNQFNNGMSAYGITWQGMIESYNNLIDAKSNADINEVLSLNDKVIHTTTDNKYYRINITSGITRLSNNITTGDLYNKISAIVPSRINTLSGTPNSNSFIADNDFVETFTISISEISSISSNGTYNISTNRYHLKDAPYDMFCIPYGDIKIYSTGSTNNPNGINTSETMALACATGIANKYGNTFLYDLQLLPYCPIESVIVQANGDIDIKNDLNLASPIMADGNIVGYIFNSNVSSWTFNIPLDNPITITNKKIQNECDMYRLVSPNFNGQFEMSVAKNNGINYFNVDCTYKPFNPYIHINPDFKSLYGQDFNDARGLIINGDFSLPIVTDQFQQYELANKNYQNIFDRGTKNLEVNNRLQNIQQLVGASGQALTTGVGAGLLTGNPILGIGAGIASAIGGVADYAVNKISQSEALDYRQDLFGMNLGNIKAMPDSITKTSAFTFNNKIYPILEFYTCTDVEKKALEDKIYYNGMSVGRIGKIEDYLQLTPSYIKAKIIRIEDISEDYHLINEIAQEINKGVFI